MKNKILILSTLVTLFSCKGADTVGEQSPNILFILADDLGYADLGCYGNEIIQTPNIDKLAAEGVRFTDCYAGASVCSPSRCTLMTGVHTGHSRIRGNMCKVGGVEGIKETPNGNQVVRRVNLLPQDSTLGNVLSNQGYRSVVVNKWHLDGFSLDAGPLDRGFDEFYGWLIHEPQSHNYYPTVRWRNREEYIIKDNLNDKHIDHNTDRATLEAIDFLRKHKEENFFLYLAYNAPHVPLDAKSLGEYGAMDKLSANDKAYAALITHMDECVGTIMQELQELNLDQNTVVIFASDNGGAKAAKTQHIEPNGELRGWKGELYEGGIRVPMIVRMPNQLNAGMTSKFPCYFPDIMPTLVDLTGGTTSLNIDGVSLMPEVLQPNSLNTDARHLYWEQYSRMGIEQAVRFGDWKLIRKDKTVELFNLNDDWKEQHNVASQNPEVVAQLIELMDESHTESENWPVNK